jgi:hypothetical protein
VPLQCHCDTSELRQSALITYDYGYMVTYDKIFYSKSTNTTVKYTESIVVTNTYNSCRQFSTIVLGQRSR